MRGRIRLPLLLLGTTILGLSAPRPAAAHRLDEYLQATRISIEFGRIGAEIDLTPGAAVAENVFAAIDRDRNGEVSQTEGAAYAEGVVRSLSLNVDGAPLPLTLATYSIPPLAELRGGEGIIRLRVSAAIPAMPSGSHWRHHLRFANTHRSDIGVYLVNALIPRDERIRITGQSRDLLQREFDLDYSVSAGESGSGETAAALPPLAAFALAGLFYAVARRFKD